MQQNKQFMESGSIMAVHIILYILVLKRYIFFPYMWMCIYMKIQSTYIKHRLSLSEFVAYSTFL